MNRSPLNARDADLLKDLVKADGLYYVKLNTPASSFTSMRASCLASSPAAKEQVALHLSTSGTPLSVSYAVVSPACRSTGAEDLVQLPDSTKVAVTRALLAPSLSSVQDAGMGELLHACMHGRGR